MSNLTQEEIDALLRGELLAANEEDTEEQDISAAIGRSPSESSSESSLEGFSGIAAVPDDEEDISQYFTPEEVDAIGEIGNICMGTSATTMNMLLGRKVTITTPRVCVRRSENVLAGYTSPILAISVEYVEGLNGKNLLILKDYDAALITDLLMGGEGVLESKEVQLTEIHLSAVSEVMNQMIGSAATAMSNMMGDSINISPPVVTRVEGDRNVSKYLDGATPVVQVSFDMEIEGLLKSQLLQIMSIEMAKELIAVLMQPIHAGKTDPTPPPSVSAAPSYAGAAPSYAGAASSYGGAAAASGGGAAGRQAQQPVQQTVKPVTYASFEDEPQPRQQVDVAVANFDLINDIPLQVTVELGKTKKNVNDVLNLGMGSIIVLDKQAGELVDVIVNGKRIARGEVVVIDENYGVRITELIKG